MTLIDSVGEAIKRERSRMGITRQELATLLGFTPQGVWKIETGRSDIPLSTLEAIGNVLDIDPAVLLLLAVDDSRPRGIDLQLARLLGPVVGEVASDRVAFSGWLNGSPSTGGQELSASLQFRVEFIRPSRTTRLVTVDGPL